MSATSSLRLVSNLFTRHIINNKILQQNAAFNNARYMCATASKNEDATPKSPAEEQKENKTAELSKQIEELNTNMADLKDKYQRTLADRENVRLRLEKQVADAKIYAIQGFCKDLLEVSDVFSKALESVSEEDLSNNNEQFKSLYNGLSMTHTQLTTVFKRHGLEVLETKQGDKFDPLWQEAMFEVPAAENQTPGTVVHVLRQGWRLKDRCLRSAQVGVAKE